MAGRCPGERAAQSSTTTLTCSCATTPTIAYQIRLRVGDTHLEGALRAALSPRYTYRVYARDERFLRVGGRTYRRNEIWRDRTAPDGVTTSELIRTNIARTLYEVG